MLHLVDAHPIDTENRKVLVEYLARHAAVDLAELLAITRKDHVVGEGLEIDEHLRIDQF